MFRFRWVGLEVNSRLNCLWNLRWCRDDFDMGFIYILFLIIVLDKLFCGIVVSILDLYLVLIDYCV